MSENRYVLDQAADDAESRRLWLLCGLYDPATMDLLGSVADLDGARVLEIGAGSGSVARWLGDQVGPAGRVLATDINTRFLEKLEHPNVEIREHNILTDPIEESSFDVVHCRFVLEHNFREAATILDNMVNALAPGGWLVAEEADHGTNRAATVDHPMAQGYDRAWRRLNDVLSAAGTNLPEFGRQLPPLIYDSGLVNVGSSASYDICSASSDFGEILRLATSSVAAAAAAGSIPGLDSEVFEPVEQALADPDFYLAQMTVVRAWGQRPF